MDARLKSRSFLKSRFSQSAFFAGCDHCVRERAGLHCLPLKPDALNPTVDRGLLGFVFARQIRKRLNRLFPNIVLLAGPSVLGKCLTQNNVAASLHDRNLGVPEVVELA